MKRFPASVYLGLLMIPLAAALAGKSGCSSIPSSKGRGINGAVPAGTPQNLVRCTAPPRFVSGDSPPSVQPMALKVEATGLTFYFESDGQHVAAIDSNGNVLWHRNPVPERGIKGFSEDGKSSLPIIIAAGRPLAWMLRVMAEHGKHGDYLAIGFTNKEFGLLDQHTGEYTSMGND